jgi:hypothetical protein
MRFEVVTTYARRHWDTHARRCVETFHEHWGETPLRAFVDEDLEAKSPWLAAFKRRHAKLPTENYRFDAVRFAHKVAAIELAFLASRADALVWMDADCVTHAPVDAAWLSGLLGHADFAYLRRARKYPECGFMVFRNNARAGALVQAVVRLYRTDELFQLAEWHDSWAIEHVRAELERAGRLTCASLSGDAERSGHPLANGPLGARLDHLKGRRKDVGRSRDSDLLAPRNEPYWRTKR